MSSYISNLVHFVWSTKHREQTIRTSWQDRLYGYLGGILARKKCKLIAAGGLVDHVHVYASLPATISLAETAAAMKANSSRWIRSNAPHCKEFAWQEGYAAFTVSKSNESRLIDYIHNQETRHQRLRFQDEFLALLKKHEIPYDERYLWV